MSLATVGRVAVPDLPELVDGLAHRSGSWVVVERLGSVVCHGTGLAECPGALAQALVAKTTGPLRAAVTWSRSKGLVRGSLAGLGVVAADLGDGATAWFLGGETAGVQDVVPLLVEALHDGAAPLHDPVVEELLHPRGPSRRGAAPQVQLLVLRGTSSVTQLSRQALVAVAGTSARVHCDDDTVVVALPLEADPFAVIAAVPGARAGVCRVAPDAADWVTAARLAIGSLEAAVALDLELGDPSDPAVAAELVLQEAQAAVGDLVRVLADAPLQRLQEHDVRGSGELVASLTAWCRAGFDVPLAAAGLHVHVNTLRYRLKRAGEVSGLDLTKPRQLLALQLLLAV